MVKNKVNEWLKRYLLAEIVGTILALLSASVAHFFSSNLIVVAYFGSLGEAMGFYSTVFIQRIISINKKNITQRKSFSFSDLTKITGAIVLEFGPAGLLDGLIMRPFFMYIFPIIFNNFTLGILIGKLVGDVTFYLFVILSYELYKYNNKLKAL